MKHFTASHLPVNERERDRDREITHGRGRGRRREEGGKERRGTRRWREREREREKAKKWVDFTIHTRKHTEAYIAVNTRKKREVIQQRRGRWWWGERERERRKCSIKVADSLCFSLSLSFGCVERWWRVIVFVSFARWGRGLHYTQPQRGGRVRSCKGFLTQDHMMSMKEMKATWGFAKWEEREEERERGVDWLFLPSHLHTVDCVRWIVVCMYGDFMWCNMSCVWTDCVDRLLSIMLLVVATVSVSVDWSKRMRMSTQKMFVTAKSEREKEVKRVRPRGNWWRDWWEDGEEREEEDGISFNHSHLLGLCNISLYPFVCSTVMCMYYLFTVPSPFFLSLLFLFSLYFLILPPSLFVLNVLFSYVSHLLWPYRDSLSFSLSLFLSLSLSLSLIIELICGYLRRYKSTDVRLTGWKWIGRGRGFPYCWVNNG